MIGRGARHAKPGPVGRDDLGTACPAWDLWEWWHEGWERRKPRGWDRCMRSADKVR